MNLRLKNKKISFKSKGFTLVEMMVAVAIFSLVMLVALGATLSVVNANKRAQALNSVINNLNFAVEAMARDLRTGTGYSPISAFSDNIEFDSSQSNTHVEYYINDGKLNKRETAQSVDKTSVLTSNGINIISLKFAIASTAQYDQPMVLVLIHADGGEEFKEIGDIYLQTLVSQRKLNI